MIIPFIEKYVATEPLRRPTLNLSKWYSPIDGIIRRLSVRAPNQGVIGTNIFNVQQSGVYLYASGSAFSMNGPSAVEKSALAIAIDKGEPLVWDLIQAGQAGVNTPIFFEIDIEPADLPGRRETVSYTTGSLANLATENADLPLGKSGHILKITADRAARIRLYNSAAYRTADASRVPGVDPTDEEGIQMDLVLEATNLVWDFGIAIPFHDAQATPTGIVKAAIENQSGSTHTVALTIETIQLED